jgi:HEAT repeat protein
MLAHVALVLALGAPPDDAYRPRHTPAPQAQGVDESLSDDEVRARVNAYLRSIDVPVSAAEWQALGPRAVPLLEQVYASGQDLPSRRAAAVAGLAAIGGSRARALVLKAAQSDAEPFAVRAAALHAAPRLLDAQELARELTPVLEKAREPSARAAAAEVLARFAPRDACAAIRLQADRDAAGGGRYKRALERCAAQP